MRLWLARRHWNLFARTDAYWAVLTEPDKQGHRWKVDEFFATGRADVEANLRRVQELLPAWRPAGAALDFGCGVGRLTQGLAAHFDQVTGVDIAKDMLALARRHNVHAGRVTYVENHDAALGRFADGSFALVLSLITLQHIAPEYSRQYLREFVRVCAPGGVVVVQVPDRALRPPPPRRFSLWPPTHWKRWKRALRRWLVLEPTMEMHPVPRAEVEAILRRAGATLLAVDAVPAAGPEFVSYRYIARRD
jgi:SAM-dependent methyltransferase